MNRVLLISLISAHVLAEKCPCTGNQGYYKGKKPDGTPYDYGKDYGNACVAHDDTDPNTKAAPADAWSDEEWCYIDCTCKEYPANPTAFLTAADDAGVDLCYSYEKCGGVDYFTGDAALCASCGGYYTGYNCSVMIAMGCGTEYIIAAICVGAVLLIGIIVILIKKKKKSKGDNAASGL